MNICHMCNPFLVILGIINIVRFTTFFGREIHEFRVNHPVNESLWTWDCYPETSTHFLAHSWYLACQKNQSTLLRVIPTMTFQDVYLDIYFIYSDKNISDINKYIYICIYIIIYIFRHSIWHSAWHIFWHSIWHILWRPIWHMFWKPILPFIWHSIWHSICHIFWHGIWHLFWQSIWHSIWHRFWHFIWHSIWHSVWHSIWHSTWHWHILWHSIWRLRSSSAHWAREVPGWGPAVPTGLGRSPVEVQRLTGLERSPVEVQQCPLISGDGCWGPAAPTGIGSWRELAVEVQQCPLWSGAGEEARRRRRRRRRREEKRSCGELC